MSETEVVVDPAYIPMVDACRNMTDLARFILKIGENKFRYEGRKCFMKDECGNWYHDKNKCNMKCYIFSMLSKYLIYCINEQTRERENSTSRDEAYRIYKRLESTSSLFRDRLIHIQNIPKILKIVEKLYQEKVLREKFFILNRNLHT